MVSVYVAPDEATANIVAGILEAEGISVMLQPLRSQWSGQAALIGTIPSDRQWGEILVFERDARRSRELVEAFADESSNVEPAERPWSWPAFRAMVFVMVAGCIVAARWVMREYAGAQALVGFCALLLALQGIALRNRAPLEFRPAMTIYSVAFLPVSAALLIAGAAGGLRIALPASPMPVLVFLALVSAAAFICAAFPNILGSDRNEQ